MGDVSGEASSLRAETIASVLISSLGTSDVSSLLFESVEALRFGADAPGPFAIEFAEARPWTSFVSTHALPDPEDNST